MKLLADKNILLGVTGGIAAYKSPDLVRRLRENGANVRVVMSQAAKKFITPMSLQAVSAYPVHDELFDVTAEAAMGHIELARWSDVVVIAPTTADFMAQLAHGHAQDLLSTLCLATEAPIVIAPAMNQQMWQAAATQTNLQILKQRGVVVFGPASGSQACGEVGPGRLMEPTELVTQIADLFVPQILSKVRIHITAGPTRELIDPVRYLSNHSSGKMGYALARAAIAAGAEVTLISGPVALTAPPGAEVIEVITAAEMYQAVMEGVELCDVFIAAAAVADYRCATPASQKISKNVDHLSLELVRNPDILASVTTLPNPPFSVGFAAQTENVLHYAQQKLINKNLDMIIANQVGPRLGFDSDNNSCTVLWDDSMQEFSLRSKEQLARDLISLIAEQYDEKNST
ncbi:bifunctional phosphopantothenoylcysteine decarboxylase/phosphopantothenate--cysteine ligase CoaBC [soil metagenome]